ncbi:hypothetical protein [Micromonospora maritima]|uniref:hypothetical protein n=1 Tax=Micromonospora maritima TaxID=986711 RepID=UPI00157C07B1|nr:hypothetical protein [Micromonospora maritima]
MSTTAQEKEIAERFRGDTAEHVMTVLHEDGLYRHLRFRAPERGFNWYDIVTWPGRLTICGDLGEAYTFSRLTDMFQFFRSDKGRINPHYWSEKLADSGRSVREYSEDVLRATLEPWLADYAEEYDDRLAEYLEAKAAYDALPYLARWPHGATKEPVEPKSPAGLRELIADYDADGLLSHREGADRLLRDLEEHGVVSDTWEWDLTDYKWEFLWACHAIVAGITAYDATKARTSRARLRRLRDRLLRRPKATAKPKPKIRTLTPRHD